MNYLTASMITITILSNVLILLMCLAFYEYGRTNDRKIKKLGLVCALGLCLVIGFLQRDVYRLRQRIQKDRTFITKCEQKAGKLVVRMDKLVKSLDKKEATKWKGEIAPPVSLSECISDSQNATGSIVATETLIKLGEK